MSFVAVEGDCMDVEGEDYIPAKSTNVLCGVNPDFFTFRPRISDCDLVL